MKRRLLIVDDSPVARRILRSTLPKDGDFEIFEAGDGEGGIAAFRAHRPDLTFLDLTMEGMDGFDCLAGIIAEAPGAVVVVVTADVQARSLERVLALGAMEVMSKPPNRAAVAAVLRRVEQRLEASDVG